MRLRFGDFLLDDDAFRLQRSGCAVALRRKVFDLLVVLVRERERVVPREELVARLWSTTTVGSGSLSGLVNELRTALGEGGHGPSSIRTVHARGYQFVAPVEPDLGAPERTILHTPSPPFPAIAAGAERAERGRFGHARVGLTRTGARAFCAAWPSTVGRARWLAGVMAEAVEAGFEARWQIVARDPGTGGPGEQDSPEAVRLPSDSTVVDPERREAGRAPIALGLEVRDPVSWSRAGGLPRLLDLLGRAPVIVIAALAASGDDLRLRAIMGSDPRIEWVGAAEWSEAIRGASGPRVGTAPAWTALAAILADLARADAAGFEAALELLGLAPAQIGPIRTPRRVEPTARLAEGRRGRDGI
ncbi:winged helix-turn-helix domain-containing protein [Myxococcota bacterium]|nr:winged helix-turn-helix domain-containing protein [Myxococcota bacterium]